MFDQIYKVGIILFLLMILIIIADLPNHLQQSNIDRIEVIVRQPISSFNNYGEIVKGYPIVDTVYYINKNHTEKKVFIRYQ